MVSAAGLVLVALSALEGVGSPERGLEALLRSTTPVSAPGGWVKQEPLVGPPMPRSGLVWWKRQPGESCPQYAARYVAEGIGACCGTEGKAPRSYWTREPGTGPEHDCVLHDGSDGRKAGDSLGGLIFFSPFEVSGRCHDLSAGCSSPSLIGWDGVVP